MLQELAAASGASACAIASMLFFIAAFAVIVVRLVRTAPAEMEARARLPLEGDGPSQAGAQNAAPSQGRRTGEGGEA